MRYVGRTSEVTEYVGAEAFRACVSFVPPARMGLDEAPMLIPEVNFAGLASALGATGVRVDRLSDLAALDSWRDAGGTAIRR